jgi:hypothetical protein
MARMRTARLSGATCAALVCAALLTAIAVAPVAAQTPDAAGADTRAASIEEAETEKAADLHPYVPNKAEKYINYVETWLVNGGPVIHPFFDSAYSGGGFTVGAGYRRFLTGYDSVDIRGSITPSGYKRIEGEFLAPRIFGRRGRLSLLGGWREATAVGYYGTGTANTTNDRANYGFRQPYGAASISIRPTNGKLFVAGSVDVSQWEQTPGSGSAPSVEEVYTPQTLPGLGASPTYVHSQLGVGIDTRPSPGYARRGGLYGITIHDYTDKDAQYGFTRTDYELIQHLPVWREAWVFSFRAAASTTATKSGEQIPFFMLPAIGGGSSLRGFSSWRFRDRNSLELQGEWRVIVNRYVDLALFYDTGKVTASSRDLNLDALKNDYGVGFRFHGPLATPLRVELARGNEGISFIFSASPAF